MKTLLLLLILLTVSCGHVSQPEGSLPVAGSWNDEALAVCSHGETYADGTAPLRVGNYYSSIYVQDCVVVGEILVQRSTYNSIKDNQICVFRFWNNSELVVKRWCYD